MRTIWFSILCLLTYATSVGGCSWGDDEAKCDSWGSCSRSCGGGERSRKCYSCAWSIEKTVTESCNEHCLHGHAYVSNCRCPAWRTGTCCETCRHTYIANCVSGHKQCGGSPDGIKCTKCDDPYYPAGFHKGCRACPTISRCIHRSCTTPLDTICKECEDDNVFFMRTTKDTKCERMCSFNNHYCWPGTCGDRLTKRCHCAPGFTVTATSSETSCQPAVKPDIETCRTVVSGINGEKVAAESGTTSTACQYLEDMYGNFQPVKVAIDMTSTFLLNTSNIQRPNFISDETLLGLTDTTMRIARKDIEGRTQQVSHHPQLEDKSQSTQALSAYNSKDDIAINHPLNDGQWLCITFEAEGGGYFRSIDFRTATPSSPIPFQKTLKTKEICYRFDDSAPKHCLEQHTCSSKPLVLESRVTRSTITRVTFNGWFDPIPPNGKSEHASQIESYGISVNEVLPSSGALKIDTTSVYTTTVDHKVSDVSFNLTSDKPRLYCVTLEVKDIAHNVQHARRFMLYDNTSFIEEWHDHPFRVTSAASDTDFAWQTHHNDICLSWKNHFINAFYHNNELLNPIEPDPHGLISGIYDQITGTLPVTGTPNVYGIIEYQISWSLNGGQFTNEITVPNYLNQSFCNDFSVQDGQTYTFSVRPVDIAGNTLVANRTVHIDRSVPHINNIWLTKDGYHTLFVHHETDLSNMALYFEALDAHSGIQNIEWTFGISDTDTELTSGVLPGATFSEQSCPSAATTCYCPQVGSCEFFNYTIPLNKLVEANNHVGNHNRNYYFTIKATNNALLSSSERIDILVDDSPPEVGVVYEGPLDSNDIDYTSEDSFIVHWHGFIDHESGIKVYRIGLASRCLGKDELYNFTLVPDIEYYEDVSYTEMSTRVPAKFIGKRYISIIALNTAMDPSNVVCSDGITRDISKPTIFNISLAHASWSESITCHNNTIWLLETALTKVQIPNYTTCNITCDKHNEELNPLIDALPQRLLKNQDTLLSDFLCQNLSKYKENIIYLPNDHISLRWEVKESLSQIEEYYVGIGVDPSELRLPLIEDYVSTRRNKHFKRQHGGIGADNMFFIFIKAVTKAHMEDVVVLGPIIIDETPPVNNEIPTVEIIGTDILVGWDNDTFYDMEQTEQIDNILFQIGCGQMFVSPVLQWKLDTSEPCQSFTGGCFKYPLRRLQEQDTDIGLYFYIDMHVFNKAGHALKVTSTAFTLPSKYSPGYAIVNDIDPGSNMSDLQTDVNVHFTESTLCVAWSGFKHHQTISLEIGIGIDGITESIEPFQNVTNNEYCCVTSTNIKLNTTYYVLIRATSSGGSTISSSNGVTIVDANDALKSLTVALGPDCSLHGFRKSNRTSLQLQEVQHNTTSLSYMYHAVVGFTYTLIRPYNDCTVGTKDGLLLKDRGNIMRFVPFKDSPVLTLDCPNSYQNTSADGRLYVLSCPSMITNRDHMSVTAHWYMKNTLPSGIFYETAIVQSSHLQYNASDTDYHITPYINTGNEMTHDFGDISMHSQTVYKVAVRTCSQEHCLNPVFSDGFTLNNMPPSGEISTASVQHDTYSKCLMLHLIWAAFTAEHGSILFYQWSICVDDETSHCLTDWQTLLAKADDQLQVNECVDFPVHSHSTLNACVRVFTDSGIGSALTLCEPLDDHLTRPYETSTIYELDATTEVWNDLKQMFSSTHLGNMFTLLHDKDINFAKPMDKLAGVLLYASERNVTWYLMLDKYVPDKCDLNKQCLTSVTTNTGFVIFNEHDLALNTIQYICAHAHNSTVEREFFTEVLEELKSCSNGFALDDTAPVPEKIDVRNTDGYLNNVRAIEINWDQFVENMNTTRLGHTSNMKQYSYAIGSHPGRSDIRSFISVGTQRNIIVNGGNIPDGSSSFITVRGEDFAGNTADAISKELIVDTSAPKAGRVHVNTLIHESETGKQEYISANAFTIYMTEFEDKESHILEYQIGLGSQPYIADIMPLVTCHENFKEIILKDIALHHGHVLFVLVKARNRAGLDSHYVSQSFVIDRSPPIGGHVIDGHWSNEIDEDYQDELTTIHGHWKGFTEHSGISYYRVGLGASPGSDNIEQFVDVGLHTDISYHGQFVAGTKYYVTVEACNGAGLCSSLSSDGIILDNSPPVQGVVNVGFGDSHHKYLPHSTFVHVQWTGFEDPHSGLQRYEMCIGTSPSLCDIVPFMNCLLQNNAIKAGLDLPINTDMYATVVALNNVGMNVTQVSDAFRVDVSPPTVLEKPQFLVDYTSINGKKGQWDKSIIHLQWVFQDTESPIMRHDISLVTHHEGQTPIEHMTIGSENKLTINLQGHSWLHGGDTYYAVVTSCNEAGLCSTAESEPLLVDATPPHLGGFRQPLTWNNFNDYTDTLKSNVTLGWYGFHDQESGIERYFISLSHSYSGNELSGGVLVVDAIQSGSEYIKSFILQTALLPDDQIILTIWAENSVGLNSSVGRATVNVLSSKFIGDVSMMTGTLEIEKHSCDLHLCNKECTCAVLGKPCAEVETHLTCSALDSVNEYGLPTVIVVGGSGNRPLDITASSACMSGSWQIDVTNRTVNQIERFEWSIGILNQPVGEGIFDLRTEIPWNDVGHGTETVYCLPTNKTLIHDEEYVVYVRAWYNASLNAVFHSEPIKVDQTPPAARKGRFIKDSNELCTVDYDIIDWEDKISACWDGVFSEQQGRIEYYLVSLGTNENADSVFKKTNVGLNKNITLQNLSLQHGTKYFFTVTAYNNAGLHAFFTSNGFLIDSDKPTAGIVFNTIRHINAAYQLSVNALGVSWHGFQDTHSGIKSYFTAIATEHDITPGSYNWINVGIQTKHTFTGVPLRAGTTYFGMVKAVDGAGHFSDIAVSTGVNIDDSPPKGIRCHEFVPVNGTLDSSVHQNEVTFLFQENITADALLKLSGMFKSTDRNTKVFVDIQIYRYFIPIRFHHGDIVSFNYTFLSPGYLSSLAIEVQTSSYQELNVDIKQCVDTDDETDEAIRAEQLSTSLIAVYALIIDKESSVQKIDIGLGATSGSFQIYALSRMHRHSHFKLLRTAIPHGTKVYPTATAENRAGLKSVFHAKPIVMDHTPPIITDLTVNAYTIQNGMDNTTLVVHAHWKVTDDETGIKGCFCRIGSEPFLSDIQPHYSSDTVTSCQSNTISDVFHGEVVHLTVICANNIQLHKSISAEPFVISILKPDNSFASVNFNALNENSATFASTSTQNVQSNQTCLELKWNDFEDLSGIASYEYRIRTNTMSLVDWTSVGRRNSVSRDDLHLVNGMYISEVRARNVGGLVSEPVSANMLVVTESPKLTGRAVAIERSGPRWHFDWREVFRTVDGVAVSYSLVMGTKRGYTDILDLDYISSEHYDVIVPESTIVSPHPSEIFVEITCVYSTGLQSTYISSYLLY